MSRRRRRSESPAEHLRAGPLRTEYRPYSVPVTHNSRDDIRTEFCNRIIELENNLREEIRRRNEATQSQTIDNIRDVIRQELDIRRQLEREELRSLLRPDFSADPIPESSNPRHRTGYDRTQRHNAPQSVPDNISQMNQPSSSQAAPGQTDNSQNPLITPIISTNPPNQIPRAFPSHSDQNSSTTVIKNTFIQPDTYDGSQSWSRYQKHFEIAAETNGWSEEMKAAQLLTRLRDKAQLILEKVSNTDKKDYKKIISLLNDRFDEKHLSRMYFNQLQARKQTKEENFQTFAEEIERLVRLAHIDMSEENRDRIACLSFIGGINDSSIEFTLRSERLESLQKAVERATELKSISQLLNTKRYANSRFSFYSQSNSRIFPPRNDYGNHSNEQNQITCLKCLKPGHYANRCPNNNLQQMNYSNNRQNFQNNNQRFHPYRNFGNTHRNFSQNRSANNYQNNSHQNQNQNNARQNTLNSEN